MVFSEFHWVPSALAAVFTIMLAFVKGKGEHKALGYATAFFSLIGLAGYISQGYFYLFSFDVHTLHAWLGTSALMLSLYNFARGAFLKKKWSSQHCRMGHIAAILSFAALLIGVMLLTGILSIEPSGLSAENQNLQVPASGTMPEVEAKEFLNIALTPLSGQGNNAIKGT